MMGSTRNIPHDSLMKQGICLAMRDECQGGIGPNHVIEFIIVDMEWLFL